MIKSIVPSSVRLIDPAVHVVQAAAQELEMLGLRSTRTAVPTEFWVSGNPEIFTQLSVQWLGCTPLVQQVNVAKAAAPYLRAQWQGSSVRSQG